MIVTLTVYFEKNKIVYQSLALGVVEMKRFVKEAQKGLDKIAIAANKLDTSELRHNSKNFKDAVYRDLEALKARINESKDKWHALLASGKLAINATAVNDNLDGIEIMLPELSDIAKRIDVCYGLISAYPNTTADDVKAGCEQLATQQKNIKSTEFDPKFKIVTQLLDESIAARANLEQRIADKAANEHADSFMAAPAPGV